MYGVLLASVLLAGLGCTLGPDLVTPLAPTAAALPADALCAEHGVLSVVCAKCNPALAVVFQSKGDWCAEHGFAESFCPICHPELGGRPAADVSQTPADGAPTTGTKVRFKTRETARLAGIITVPAQEAPRTESVPAVARVVYDAARTALVSTPVPGLVSEVRADVGTRVRQGTPLAVIQSASINAARAQHAVLRSRVDAMSVNLKRHEGLLGAGVSSPRDVQDAQQALASANAELAALEAQLAVAGEGTAGAYTLRAPLSGELTQRDVTVGMVVDGGAPLFQIADASRMWVELNVAEAELSRIAVGSSVTVMLDTLPDHTFDGAITYISPSVSPQTRTATARVPLDNPDGLLREHMYGTANIAVGSGRPTVTVPVGAVQRAKGVDLVFVKVAIDEYVTRRVTVASRAGDEVRLSEGVEPGEEVVTTGSFLLKTETLKDSIGAGCCDVE